jgi:hypothetical protein
MLEPEILLRDVVIPEPPRWHEGRPWFCNWIDRPVVAVGLDGKPEVMVTRDLDSHPMGYSIRPFEAIVGDGLGYASGNILGIYAYGLFESDNALAAYTGIVPPPLDDTLEQLADLIDAHIDIAWLSRCLGLPGSASAIHLTWERFPVAASATANDSGAQESSSTTVTRRGSGTRRSTNRLAESDEVSFTVAEPCGALTACPARRIVPVDRRDAVRGAKSRCVVLLEHHTAGAQFTHRVCQVVNLECDLRVGSRGTS